MRNKDKVIAFISAIMILISIMPAASAFSYTQMMSELGIRGYEITPVAPGAQHIELRATNPGGYQNINAIEFNPKNQYTELRAGKSAGYVYSVQTVNTIANNMSNTDGGNVAVAAINGDFFTFGVGVPQGVFIDEGIILSSPPQYYGAFGITFDNKPFIQRHGTILDIAFHIGEASVPVAGINMTHAKGADSLMLFTEDYARGTKTGSETYEVRCRVNSGKPKHGETLNFTVTEIHNAVGNTALGEGYVVLSAQGAGRIADLKKLKVGDTLEMSFRFNEFWSNVKFAVGGTEMILKDGKVNSTTDTSAQPRTAIGIRADGTVVMATIDGRKAGGAVGMSHKRTAEAMRALGCVDALNLDGGGSTTFVLRKPGELKTSVVNNVSGSSPRQVGNAIVLMNTAPTGAAKNLTVVPQNRLVMRGGHYSFKVTTAYDANYKPLPVPENITWKTDVPANTITASGVIIANQAGKTTVTATGGAAEGSASIQIVDKPSTITTDKTQINAKGGETVTITATAYLDGNKIDGSQNLFTWSAPETLGTFTEPGKLKILPTASAGNVTVSFGGVSATVKVNPDISTYTISGFESDNATFVPVAVNSKVAPNVTFETDVHKIHNGSRSLKTTYDFLDNTGSVGAYYMVSPHSADASAFRLATAPKKLGMYVYGDASGVALRSIIELPDGKQHSLNYGTINHVGWKYMEATLPTGLTGPIYVKVPVHIVSNPQKLTKGLLCFDNLIAIYKETNVDRVTPVLTKAWPYSNTMTYAKNPSIGVIIRDDRASETDSGIDPSSVEIWVNGYNCKDRKFDTKTGKISYTVKYALKPGYHTIHIRARDRSGNLLVRNWKFEVR